MILWFYKVDIKYSFDIIIVERQKRYGNIDAKHDH